MVIATPITAPMEKVKDGVNRLAHLHATWFGRVATGSKPVSDSG
jgi:hypothetical protein